MSSLSKPQIAASTVFHVDGKQEHIVSIHATNEATGKEVCLVYASGVCVAGNRSPSLHDTAQIALDQFEGLVIGVSEAMKRAGFAK